MSNLDSGDHPRDPIASEESRAEIDRLKERLAFFESFDQVIHDNIARSGDLLRQALELRETAGREMQMAKAEQERTDLARYRATLAALLEDVTSVQGQVERLGRRLSDAIEEAEAKLPPDEPVDTPQHLPGVESIAAQFLESPPEYIAFATPEERSATMAPEPEQVATPTETAEPPSATVAAQEAPLDEAEVMTVSPFDQQASGEITVEPTAPPQESQAPVLTEAEELRPEPEPAVETHSLTILVHGVPRAATALSLQRYLSQLAQVDAVEPREYAEGVLRLYVVVRQPVSINDLRGWNEGAGFETVHAGDDLIEVRLPSASGF